MAEFIYTMTKARKAHGDKVILDDVTMSFFPGAKIGVVGPNGAGKSTILKIMAGLEQPSNGEARLSPGYSVGILMQEPSLNEDKTVLGNVEEGLGQIKADVDRFNAISAEMAEPDADFDTLMEEDDENFVYWVEKRGRGCFLQATPIDVSSIVAERLFRQVDTVVLTSATLAVSGGFDFTEKRLGLENARTLVVPGHFDYQQQALLYVPQHLPEPKNPAFTKMAAEEVVKILEHSRGRAFVLFTSYQQMRLVYEKV